MKAKAAILALSLIATTTVSATPTVLNNAYTYTCNKICNNRGKAGIVVGAVGGAIVSRIFRVEIDSYVKPFFKSIWTRSKRFFSRIFRKRHADITPSL